MLKNRYHYEILKKDRLLFLKLSGEIDHHSAVSLRAELDELILSERPMRFVMELSGINFMDSAGLGLLLGRCRLMRELGGVLVLAAPNEGVLKILRLAGMDRFVEIVDEPRGEKR